MDLHAGVDRMEAGSGLRWQGANFVILQAVPRQDKQKSAASQPQQLRCEHV